ncbi:hypothetical protein BDV93DRAFT_605772 [Ceratobasidium sp. AG-I]|nr:hypothetical protein BDV93DRAFT_605772 [Ceratobasidium sp. AG-I]
MIALPCNLKAATPPSEFKCLYDGPQPENITLIRQIHGGPRCWSQVYEVNIFSWKRLISWDNYGSTFVLKLYVPSELTCEEGWDLDVTNSPVSDPEGAQSDMVRREKEAYQKLNGCPVAPRWYGTYEFELPSGEKCMGAVLDYLQGEPLSKRYAFGMDGERLPVEHRMIAAAEALDQIHSRGVSHGDIKRANIILIPGAHNCLQMMFVDFGAATTCDTPAENEKDNMYAEEDCEQLYRILLSCLSVSPKEIRPLLRALPRQGPIIKFLDVAGIRATYEEQLEEVVRSIMSFGNSEQVARNKAISVVT